MTKRLISTLIAVCSLTLFSACEHEIEYRDIIKEIPVEVPVKIPVEVPVKIPVEVPVEVLVEDETKINELNARLEELKLSYETQLAGMNETYKAKLEELRNTETDRATLLQKIDELQEEHQREIETLTESHDAEIAELRRQVEIASQFEIYELRVFRLERRYEDFEIFNLVAARAAYESIMASNTNTAVESKAFREPSFRQHIESSPYYKKGYKNGYGEANYDMIVNDVKTNKLAYGYYKDGVNDVIVWFVKVLW